jgi:hypothetical protein
VSLAVAIAVGGEGGAADRHVPEVGIIGVDRLRPRVAAVKPGLAPGPCIAAVLRAMPWPAASYRRSGARGWVSN